VKQKRASKQRKLSASHIAGYLGIFSFLIAIVAVGYDAPKGVGVQQADLLKVTAADATYVAPVPSVDEVIATDITADLAERANLPIAASAASMSISMTVKSELAQTDTTAVSKPQIVKPTNTNRSITTYKAKKGDTVSSLAGQFGISANTIRWANNMADTDAIEPGRKLVILPVSGVLHTVQSGETAGSIAQEYRSNAARIVSINDLELSGVKAGNRIVVPDGVKPVEAAPVTTQTTSAAVGRTGSISSSIVDVNLAKTSAGNRYYYGNCTWYAYERRAQLGRPVGSFWGNANTWAINARTAGYPVNNNPAAGAVLVDSSGYFGHVGVVERVKSNGDIVITEMNNYAYGGFGIVNQRTISAGQARGYQYIH